MLILKKITITEMKIFHFTVLPVCTGHIPMQVLFAVRVIPVYSQNHSFLVSQNIFNYGRTNLLSYLDMLFSVVNFL